MRTPDTVGTECAYNSATDHGPGPVGRVRRVPHLGQSTDSLDMLEELAEISPSLLMLMERDAAPTLWPVPGTSV
jgi:hypothetical protein